MAYLVTFDNGTEEKYPSVTKAFKAVEQSFQNCGDRELKEVKSTLRSIGMVNIKHGMTDRISCWIEVV